MTLLDRHRPLRAPAVLGRGRRRARLMAGAAMALALSLPAAPTLAGPKGGVVKAGDARIITRDGKTIIRQRGQRVVIDWSSFDIDADEVVRFVQPDGSAVALNRIMSGLPSHIRGKLLANGNVWLVNPAGVMFHAGSVVDVGGLIATTADIPNERFMRGDDRFTLEGDPDAKIVNEGSITFGEAGLAALVAPQAENHGVIAGKLGRIVVAGQKSFSVEVTGEGLFEIDLADAAKFEGAKAVNTGYLIAEGGTVVITASAVRNAVEAAVSVGGVIEAKSARVDGGAIILDGGDGAVEVSGRLDASSGAGQGGSVDVTGGTVLLADGARVDASGAAGGGTARIGGGFGGKGPDEGGLRPARAVAVEAGAEIVADATSDGEGGRVALWSSAATWMGGRVSARGAGEGAGGYAELASAGVLGFDGVADLSAASGLSGLLRIDVDDVRIVGDGAGGSVLASAVLAATPPDRLTIAASALSASSAEMRIQAGRDIAVARGGAVANLHDGASLTLAAAGDIDLHDSLLTQGALSLAAGVDFSDPDTRLASGAIRAHESLSLTSQGDALSLTAPEGVAGADLSGGALTLFSAKTPTLGDIAIDGRLEATSLQEMRFAALSAQSLDLVSRGDLTLAGPAIVRDRANLATAGGEIVATNAGNVFKGTVQAMTDGDGASVADVTLVSGEGIRLGPVSADQVTLRAQTVSQLGALHASSGVAIDALWAVLPHSGNDFGDLLEVEVENFALFNARGRIRFGEVTGEMLIATAHGPMTQAAGTRLSVSNTTSLASNGGVVALDGANRFGSNVSVNTSGGDAAPQDVTISAEGDLSLGTVVADQLRVEATGALTQTAALTTVAGSDLSADSLSLLNVSNNFGDVLEITSNGEASLVSAGATLLGEVSAGALTLQAANPLAQVSGTRLRIAGETRLTTVGGSVTLLGANEFGGATRIDTTGQGANPADVALRAEGALHVAAVARDLDLQATSAISTAGPLSVAGDARISTFDDLGDDDPGSYALADILLNAPDLQIGGKLSLTGALVEVETPGDIGLSDSWARDGLSLSAGGDVTLARVMSGQVEPSGAGLALSQGAALSVMAGGAILGEDLAAGDVDLTGGSAGPTGSAPGSVDVTLDRVIARSLEVEAGQGELSLNDVSVTGAMDLESAGDLTLRRAQAGRDIRLLADGRLRLDGVRAQAVAGEAASVDLGFLDTGDLTLVARSGDIATRPSLIEPGLTGGMSFEAAAPALPLGADGAPILQSGEARLASFDTAVASSGTADLSASGDILIGAFETGGAELFSDLNRLRATAGGVVDIQDRSGLTLAEIVAGSLRLEADADGLGDDGDVNQIAAARISGATRITTTGTLNLWQDNAFGGAVTLRGADAEIAAKGDLDLTETRVENLTAQAGGDLSLAESAVASELWAEAGEDISLSDVIAGETVLTAAGSVEAAFSKLGALTVSAAGEGPSASGFVLRESSVDGGLTVLAAPSVRLEGVSLSDVARLDFGEAREGLALIRVRSDGDFAADVTGDIRLMMLEAAGDLSLSSAGDIRQAQDAQAGPLAPATTPASFEHLLASGGALALSAANIDLPGAVVDGDERLAHTRGPVSLTASGDTEIAFSGDVSLSALDVGGNASLRLSEQGGAPAGLTQIGKASVGGMLSLDVAGDVDLDRADNVFTRVSVAADNATLRESNGFEILGATLSGGLSVGAGGAAQEGDVTLDAATLGGDLFLNVTGEASVIDADIGGEARVDAGGALSMARVSLANDLTATAGGDASLAAVVARDASFETGGALSGSDLDFDQLDVAAQGPITLADLVAAGRVDLVSGGALALSNAEAARLYAQAEENVVISDIAYSYAEILSLRDISATGLSGGSLQATADGTATIAQASGADMTVSAGAGALLSDLALSNLQVASNGDASINGTTVSETIRITSEGDAALREARVGSLRVTAGRDSDISNVSYGSANIFAQDGAFLTRVSGGDLALESGGEITAAQVSAAALTMKAGADAALSQVAAQTLEAQAGGDLSAADSETEAGMTLTAGGDLIGQRLSLDRGVFTSGRDMELVAVRSGALDLAVGGKAALQQGDLGLPGDPGDGPSARSGLVRVDSDGEIVLSDVIAGDMLMTAADGLTLSGFDAASVEAEVGGPVSVSGSRFFDLTVTTPDTTVVSHVDAQSSFLTSGLGVDISGSRFGSLRVLGGENVSVTVTAAETARLRSDADMAISRSRFGGLTVDAGGELQASQIDAEALSATSGGAMAIADLSYGTATLDAGGAMSLSRAAGGELIATSEGALSARDLATGRAILSATGDLSLARIATDGTLVISGRGATAQDLAIQGDLAATTQTELDLVRSAVEGDATVMAGGDVSVAQLSVGGQAVLTAGDGGDAGQGDLTVSNLRARSLAAEAGGAFMLDAAEVTGDTALRARGGELRLGTVQAGGDLAAVADQAAIVTIASAAVAPGWGVAGPDAPNGAPKAVAAKARARDETNVSAVVEAHEFKNLLRVDGQAAFSAGGDVLLPGDGASGLGNDFRGGVSVAGARRVAISDVDDLRIGGRALALPNGLTAQPGIQGIGGGQVASVLLEAGGHVSDSDDARILAAGDMQVIAGGDVALDSGLHDVAGAIAVEARDLTLAVLGDLHLGPLDLSGDLQAMAGADGRLGARLDQRREVETARLAMADGAADRGAQTQSGAIEVGGDADFSTGASLEKTVSDLGGDLTLDFADNVFGGDIALRRIFGAAILVEEADAATLARDARDGGELSVQALEVGGDVTLRTSDDIVLAGRMTSLRDDQTPSAPVSVPGRADQADWAAQGAQDIAREDLRLFINDGATVTLDATAGGADASGGDIRIDRPVDGANSLSVARDPEAVSSRIGAGALTLNAGETGDIRLRDYVGAGAPLGRIAVVEARNLALGTTYVSAQPDAQTPETRYLLRSGGPMKDILTAYSLDLNLHGAATLRLGPGVLREFRKYDDYYGVNLAALTYAERVRPEALTLSGYLGESGAKAAGLFPEGPRDVDYSYNDCVIGDVLDCTGVSSPQVLQIVRIEQAILLQVDEDELLELFVSYGNEELWGVPQGYFVDLDVRGATEADAPVRQAPRSSVPASTPAAGTAPEPEDRVRGR